jgi:hypothetical protein
MTAKRLQFIFVLVATFIAIAQATPPPMTTPPKPPFPAWEAAKLADAYVAKTFPQFPDLYCSEVDHIDPRAMLPDKTVVWSLRYLIPDNPRLQQPGNAFPDWGVCLVWVHQDKTVTHTIAPKAHEKP